MIMMKKLSLQITQARVDKGWLISDLAQAAGIPVHQVADMEAGSTGANVCDLVQVASALGMKVDVRFTVEEAVERNDE